VTNEELTELERLLSERPGPWAAVPVPGNSDRWEVHADEANRTVAHSLVETDARLIAEVPRLVARVRELEGAAERATAEAFAEAAEALGKHANFLTGLAAGLRGDPRREAYDTRAAAYREARDAVLALAHLNAHFGAGQPLAPAEGKEGGR
jgi:hypothetical protein